MVRLDRTTSSQGEQGTSTLPGGITTANLKRWLIRLGLAGGASWFGIVEPPQTHVLDLYTLAFSARTWFLRVRGGSLQLNHPTLV